MFMRALHWFGHPTTTTCIALNLRELLYRCYSIRRGDLIWIELNRQIVNCYLLKIALSVYTYVQSCIYYTMVWRIYLPVDNWMTSQLALHFIVNCYLLKITLSMYTYVLSCISIPLFGKSQLNDLTLFGNTLLIAIYWR